jgi:hypothetical protein
MGREPRRVAPGGAEVALPVPSDPTRTILRRGSMARKFARILLATLVGVALGGITACDQSGPGEQAEVEMEETIDVEEPIDEMDEVEEEESP